MGQGLENLPFSLEKTLQAADMCFRRHGVEGCLSLGSIPSSLAQLLRIIPAFHSTSGEAAGWLVAGSLKELSSLVAWLCRGGYF